MLVDLGRNDVGRVCDYGTVRVTELMRIERFSHVMHIVSDVQGRLRAGGPYAGAVGYVGFSGNMDTAITIRTIVVAGDRAYVQAGAGIVADSVPEREYVGRGS